MSAAKLGANLYFIDGKRADLYALRFAFKEEIREKHFASTPQQACRLLRELVDQMNLRYETYFSNDNSSIGENYTSYNLRPVFLFFDEIIAIMGVDKKLTKEIESYLLQIILLGRQSGYFSILSSQRFSAEVLSTTIRENSGMRVALGRMSKDSYKMVLGDFYDNEPGRVGGNLSVLTTDCVPPPSQNRAGAINAHGSSSYYSQNIINLISKFVDIHFDSRYW